MMNFIHGLELANPPPRRAVSPFTILSAVFAFLGSVAHSADAPARTSTSLGDLELPVVFEPNIGQFASLVRFAARTPAYDAVVTSHSVDLVAVRSQDAIAIELIGSNANNPLGEIRQASVSNYLRGGESASIRGVPNYSAIRFVEAYTGIDWVIHASAHEIEHDFVVNPRADAGRIAFRFRGARKVHIHRDGSVEMRLAHGMFVQRPPVAYQIDQQGRHQTISIQYRLSQDTLRFAVGKYDLSRQLIIDPPLAYSTYLGGTHADMPNRIAVDSKGNVYVAGMSNSTDFPEVGGKLPATNHSSDLFIAKLNASGSALEYSTYLGASAGSTTLSGLTVDIDGDVFISGSVTGTRDFPTVDAYQPDFKPATTSSSQGFIAKVDPTGSQLIFSTYLGGSSSINNIAALAIDQDNNVFVTGETNSFDFPVNGAFQSALRGRLNAFVTELSADGQRLVYSTFLGGSAADNATGLVLDSNQNVVLVGLTNSLDFPLASPLQSANKVAMHGSTNFTGFVSKLNLGSNSLVFSTYLGGSTSDQLNAVAVDSQNNIVVAGSTLSIDYPIKAALQTSYKSISGGNVVISKLAPAGTLLWSTFLGGSGGGNGLIGDQALAVTLDGNDNVYVAGGTSSTDFPVSNAIQTTNNSTLQTQNGFVSEISGDGHNLLFSTYLGGSTSYGIEQAHTTIPHADFIADLVVHGSDIYVTGQTASNDFPTANPYQSKNKTTTQYGSNPTGFVAKLGTQVSSGGGTGGGGALGGGSTTHGGSGAFIYADLLGLLAVSISRLFSTRTRSLPTH